MRRSIVTALLVTAAAVALPAVSSAQLTPTTPACTASNALATFGATNCAGAFVGNNKNQQADVLAQLAAFGGTWTTVGSSDDANSGPFTSNPGGSSGTLAFDNLLAGPFVLAIKAGNAFSLYYFLNAGAGVRSVNFTTVGTAVNQNGIAQDLSHATLYTRVNVVPEPSTVLLLASGLLGMLFVTRRRRA